MAQCRVQMLDGTDVDFEIDKKAIGEELMSKVCEKLQLSERDYFGLTYVQSHVKFWINMKKYINKQIKKGPWIVAFELKFYPDPMILQDESTRFLVFQQVRRDILSGKLPCSFITLALLSSYAVQSQLGDYNPDTHGNTVDYLKGIEFSPTQNDELLEKVAELHRTHRGQTPPEAEMYYLDNAKNLALYGVHMHEAKDSDGDDVSIGVCAAGILIYKDRLRIHRFTWPKILKIRYKRNNFHVDIRPGENDPKAFTLSYKLINVKMAKRLWRIAVEHHAFFRLRESEAGSRGRFSRSPYRYSGKTLYQTQREAALGAGGRFAGSRSMDNLALGYSTERWEAHVADKLPTTTLDLKRQKAGSMADLDASQYDNDLEGNIQLLSGPGYNGYAPYSRSANGSIGYQPAGNVGYQTTGSQRGYDEPANQGYANQQYYGGSQDGASLASRDHSVRPPGGSTSGRFPVQQPQWNGGIQMRPGSVASSDISSLQSNTGPRAPRRKRISSRSSQQSSRTDERSPTAYQQYNNDPGYSTINEAGGDEWIPHSTSMAKTSTRTYTAPDGTVITEYRTEKNGVIETHIEKRTRIASVPEEDVDYDKELADAIFAVTDMNPHLSVQKIEIHTRSEEV